MRGKLIAVGAACAAIVAVGATYALAQSSATDTLRACANDAGLMRLVGADASCRKGETAVEWNVAGPAGPQGPKGDPGPPGAPAGGPSFDGTIAITGQQQGAFQGSDGPVMEIVSFSHEIVSPRDAASGLPTGRRQHKPIVITKEIDKASPLIFRALVNNESLTEVLIGLLKDGNEVATVKLTNASVAGRAQKGNSEEISFTYQRIEWKWLDGGITAEDDWETPVG